MKQMKLIASGSPACGGKVEGVARVVRSLDEIGKVNNGDILVTEYTSPQFHPALMKASAIVASAGGRLSHSAIVARELGIPCVVAVKNALDLIKDGTKILVDGDEGKIFEL